MNKQWWIDTSVLICLTTVRGNNAAARSSSDSLSEPSDRTSPMIGSKREDASPTSEEEEEEGQGSSRFLRGLTLSAKAVFRGLSLVNLNREREWEDFIFYFILFF